ncbi:hypothetical protein GCM10023322_40360 [Rugosimonospora acidiphila]|uniref:Winged helix DNA-binding domain-containing protein n=1 Tax=Rugosimonospora acidiphila TaxID=556531 RepID=A0ABP9RYH7_9ACTN
MSPHPTQRIDELAHQRVRLGVLALLSRCDRISFTDLRDTLGQSDGGLGRHLRVLEEAGYVLVEKTFEQRRPRTWASLTGAGRAAVDAERAVVAVLAAALGPDPAGGGAASVAAGSAGFVAPLLKPSAAPPRAGRCAELILRNTYAGYSVEAEGPMGDGFRVPEGFGPWPGYEAQRMAFLSHHLRDGYVRRWRDPDGIGRAAVLLVELGDPLGPRAILSTLDESTAHVPGLLKARAYRFDAGGANGAASAVVWLAQRPFVACVWVSEAAHLVENRAAVLARDQFRVLAPEEPIALRLAGDATVSAEDSAPPHDAVVPRADATPVALGIDSPS